MRTNSRGMEPQRGKASPSDSFKYRRQSSSSAAARTRFDLFHPHVPKQLPTITRDCSGATKKNKAALAATCQRELQLRLRLRSGGQRRRRRIDGVDPRGSAGTTLIWPRRNNGTNCSDSAAQWPLLVRQARHVTGKAGAAQWFEHPAPGERAPHAAQIWRTTSIPKKNTGEPEESPSKREAVDHCGVFQRPWEVLNN